ncbi:hypothetical protein [Krasilnikovia sp. MM14-A1004]|uniref:hypothetical protein n=1 Tax=Krasilnikovia sp. MM14-A1004 TaxID=3373541 RepID=UPI00399D4112
MSDETITAEQARTALAAAAASRRRLLARSGPWSLTSVVAAIPTLMVMSAFQDRTGPSGWWYVAILGATASSVAGLVLDRRRPVQLRWNAAGPAGWLLLLVVIAALYGTWFAAAALLQALNVPLAHTVAGVIGVAVLLGIRGATNRAFRWLAVRRDVA